MGETKLTITDGEKRRASYFAVRNEEIVKADMGVISYHTWGIRVLFWRKRAVFPAEFTLQRDIPFYLLRWMLHGN